MVLSNPYVYGVTSKNAIMQYCILMSTGCLYMCIHACEYLTLISHLVQIVTITNIFILWEEVTSCSM